MLSRISQKAGRRRGGWFNPLKLNPSQYCELKVTSNDIYFEDKTTNANHIDIVGSPWFKTVSTMGSNPQKTGTDCGTITEFSIGITIILDDSYVNNCGLFYCFGLALRPNAATQNLTVVAPPHTVTATPNNSMPLGQVKRVWVTTKSGGRQKVYINGQVVSDVAAGTFSYSGAQTLRTAGFSARANARFCNFQIFNKQLSDSDIAYDFANKYNTVFDNPAFSLAGTYTAAKDIMILWWKFAEGYATMEFDASGNGRNSDTLSLTGGGWSYTNDYWHSTQVHGAMMVSDDSGATYRAEPFGLDKTPVDKTEPLSGVGYYRIHFQDGKTFFQNATKLQQRNIGVEDYNNFWYDAGGVRLQKSFTDFVANTGDKIFADISETFKLKNITSIATLADINLSRMLTFVKNGVKYSKNLLIFGDSMPSSLREIFNKFQYVAKKERFAIVVNEGGEHGYVVVEGKWQVGTDDATKMPLDIKTRYPDHSEIWGNYNTEVQGNLPAYLTTRAFEKDYIFLQWHGTNNPQNLYNWAYDYLQQHWRLTKDVELARNQQTNTYKRGIVIGHGNIKDITAELYDSTMVSYAAKCAELGLEFINPKTFFRDIYNTLFANSVDNAVLQKLIQLDVNSEYIVQQDGQWYIWSSTAPSTDASGTPITVAGVQQTVAKWTRLDCNVPNTLVTINGTQYDVFNPQLLAGSVNGNPFILDDPTTWPSSLHRDNIHPNTFALACLVAQMYLILESKNW